MRVVLVHDWMIHMRGGEKVLEALAELYPDAVIHTLFCDRKKLSPVFQNRRIQTSFLQKLPGIKAYYRYLLPLLPWMIRTLPIEGPVDKVISSSHCVAKGIRIPAGAVHICYCHTPMRYLWGFEKDYLGNIPNLLQPLVEWVKSRLKKFDLDSNRSVDAFIANSRYVQRRIENYYGRQAEVIYPPVDLSFYEKNSIENTPTHYYLVVSAFVPYKRVDIVIEAFNRMDRKLLIVGNGPLEKNYRRLRKNSNIYFLGAVSNAELSKLYHQAKAVIFPTEEDFGIVPLEAQACGTPVIAYAKGGALESVKHGVFFEDQTPESLQQAIENFETLNLDRSVIPDAVRHFSKERFKQQIGAFVASHPERDLKICGAPA